MVMEIREIVDRLSEYTSDEINPIRHRVSSVLRVCEDTLASARDLSEAVHPGVLRSLGIIESLRWLTENIQESHGIRCLFLLNSNGGHESDLFDDQPINAAEPVLDEDQAVNVYRIAQECLNNTVKHAKAKLIIVSVISTVENFSLSVRDDGIGMLKAHSDLHSSGINGIRRRAIKAGGKVYIKNSRKNGIEVIVSIPNISDN
jgi:two-component system, NarL family, sensor histidine kinase UhpB